MAIHIAKSSDDMRFRDKKKKNTAGSAEYKKRGMYTFNTEHTMLSYCVEKITLSNLKFMGHGK